MPVDYQSLNNQLAALIADETDALANSANFVGLLYAGLPDIVCDPRSRSEVVVPLSIHGELIGVLDIDSSQPSRFSAADQSGVELLCETYSRSLLLNPGGFI